jgi:hypothetical protein
MMSFCLLLPVLMAGMLVGTAIGMESNPIDLEAYQWNNRVLIVLAPSPDHPLYRTLESQISVHAGGVTDRDLVIFRLFEMGESRVGPKVLTKQQAFALRTRFSVKSGQYVVILIGKDGGIKLRREARTDLADIFGLIDSMPMRQKEMQERSKNR